MRRRCDHARTGNPVVDGDGRCRGIRALHRRRHRVRCLRNGQLIRRKRRSPTGRRAQTTQALAGLRSPACRSNSRAADPDSGYPRAAQTGTERWSREARRQLGVGCRHQPGPIPRRGARVRSPVLVLGRCRGYFSVRDSAGSNVAAFAPSASSERDARPILTTAVAAVGRGGYVCSAGCPRRE